MSWNASFSSKAELYIGKPSFGFQYEEHDEEFRLGIKLANEIIDSGLVGSGDKEYHINLSGHVNPNHEPAPGWANDCLTVTVSQK